MTQLDLFDWQKPAPPSAEIRAFPSHKMVGAIRCAADRVLAAKSQRKELDRLEGVLAFRLWRIGIPHDEAMRSASRYRTEILCELLRRQRGVTGGRRGGAA